MNLDYSVEELAFREEVAAFIAAECDSAVSEKLRRNLELDKHEIVAWTRRLNRRGWAAPHWPVEWGGAGWTLVQQMIFRDEIQRAPAPDLLSFGVSMVGPVIYTFGSEAQKRRFLPRIANMDDWWCQGFSEPGAGSDLASLRTTARRDGNEWVISGQKTWTTLAQHADWIFVLARTDAQAARKQQGISFLLVDMRTAGISVRPIKTIDGSHEINEVFFDDVRVPLDALVGEENKGWDYARFLLGNERIGQARVGLSKARLARIRTLLEARSAGMTSLRRNGFAARLAELEVELSALEITQLRFLSSRTVPQPGRPDPLASLLKIRGSEIVQATTALMLDIAGLDSLSGSAESGQDAAGNQDAQELHLLGSAAASYFNHRKVSIYGGSNEIQRNIIAQAILGV
ncbi:MAG: acyl-CoA dehydrogenase family protein [Burkholderiaceae bacterium]|nr:acyl-CoA dehydrogenase family protein [Burkholderiaceae bacterium]MDO9091008.1 acyl-CoA dehydrogenase family protein [Burkholderiaceae bacterium]